MTIRGPVAASELGTTLMHEHVFANLMRELRTDGLMNDVPVAVHEVGRFRQAGGQTIVDVTNANMGRQPAALRYVSEQTDVHIVLGCGLYRHQYFDADWIDRQSTDALAEWIVRDLTVGIDGTDVKAGIIGEIACDEWLTAQEERSFRAAARAHKQTGVTITTHAARWPVGLVQLDLLVDEEGVDPNRIIIGHSDLVASVDWRSGDELLRYQEALAQRGAWVQFDTIRKGNLADLDARVRYVCNMFDKGFGDRVLLSHDLAWRSAMSIYGGSGYAYLFEEFVPRLRAAGVSEAEVQQLLVDNPRRALTGEGAQ